LTRRSTSPVALISLIALIALLACSVGEPGAADLAPGEFRVGLSASPDRRMRRDPARGEIEVRGRTVAEHIAIAWNVPLDDLNVRAELPPERLDLAARSVDGSLAGAEALLRGGIAEHFGLRVRSEPRRVPVFVLRRSVGGLAPERLEPGTVEGPPAREIGRYRGAGAPISDLVLFLRRFGRRPVVDETRLAGEYDIVLEWDPEAGGRALHAALGDAGFVLEPSEREIPVPVVAATR
jgi:uncharacterized protein (TIGR03435 family)